MPSLAIRSLLACTLALLVVLPARGTWSLVLCDEATGEVAMGTVTCVTGIDLLASTPAVVVGRGGAFVQSFSDPEGTRRPIMFDGLAAGTDPEVILLQLAEVPDHERRQYGIADTQGRAVTFSGDENGEYAGGVTGTVGTITYAIQGNVIAGACVVDVMEDVIRNEPGDLPAKLMAAMEAARSVGGDGRCSCNPGSPTECGCPVEVEFEKSGHVGGLVVARIGDTDDGLCNANGCADGDYFMRINVRFQGTGDPEPVFQLQAAFDAWRTDHEGRPDAVHSLAVFAPEFIPANGVATTTMTVTLRDWRDLPIGVELESVSVVHAPGSAGQSTIGPIADNGDGTIDVTLTAGTEPGVDRFRVVVVDGIRPVTLMPDPALVYYPIGDADGSGSVDVADILAVLAAWGPCPEPPAACLADLDGSGTVDFADVLLVIGGWTTPGACCFAEGTCGERTTFQCALEGGSFRGAGTTCDDACPFGACCFVDRPCRTLADFDCLAQGGLFQGDGMTCDGGTCDYDGCANAVVVSEGSFAFSTVGATDEGPALPETCDEGSGLLFRKDVWFRYTASCDGTATASVCDGTFDTRLAVYEIGKDCPGAFLACNDNACGEGGTRSRVAFPVEAGGTYLVRIGARFAVGEGTLVIDCVP